STPTHHTSLPLFFFNHPPPTQTYTLSLHDALPISPARGRPFSPRAATPRPRRPARRDRKTSPPVLGAHRARAGDVRRAAGPSAAPTPTTTQAIARRIPAAGRDSAASPAGVSPPRRAGGHLPNTRRVRSEIAPRRGPSEPA